jgi:hypothetical protein
MKDFIVFSTRLWDPAKNNELWKKEERKILNEQRISLVKILRNKFNPIFNGGVLKEYFAEQVCPNEIVPPTFSHKKAYLKLLKKATICVTNQGLEDSIGWKLAEYVANSSAILTTPIAKYLLPGNFKEGVHYLTFKNENEFLEKLELLLRDRTKRNTMMQNNHVYYNEYLHPLAKMKRIINLVTITNLSK